jgi:hypothetical protein
LTLARPSPTSTGAEDLPVASGAPLDVIANEKSKETVLE